MVNHIFLSREWGGRRLRERAANGAGRQGGRGGSSSG